MSNLAMILIMRIEHQNSEDCLKSDEYILHGSLNEAIF